MGFENAYAEICAYFSIENQRPEGDSRAMEKKSDISFAYIASQSVFQINPSDELRIKNYEMGITK
jgi:hypothetical protein